MRECVEVVGFERESFACTSLFECYDSRTTERSVATLPTQLAAPTSEAVRAFLLETKHELSELVPHAREQLSENIMYIATAEDFCREAKENLTNIVDQVATAFENIQDEKATGRDRYIWNVSITALADLLCRAGFSKQIVILEYCLPKVDKNAWPYRIDALILGLDYKGNHRIAVIEMKKWKNIISESTRMGMLNILTDDGVIRKPHPAKQSCEYEIMLHELSDACGLGKDFLHTKAFSYVDLGGSEMTAARTNALFGSKSRSLRRRVVLNTSEYPQNFSNKLKEAVGYGDGQSALYRLMFLLEWAKQISKKNGGMETIGEMVSKRTIEKMRDILRRSY